MGRDMPGHVGVVMSRTKLPGLSRERIRVFRDVLRSTTPSAAALADVLEYVTGDHGGDALVKKYPSLSAAVIAAEAGKRPGGER